MVETPTASRRARALLALGAAAGLLLAGVSVLERAPRRNSGGELPEGIVAVVNGVPISRADLDAALALAAAGGSGPLSEWLWKYTSMPAWIFSSWPGSALVVR